MSDLGVEQDSTDRHGPADLTVVVLTYNSASTLRVCLDSLVKQDNRNFEVLIVDDDSTDGTVAIARAYSSELTLSVVRNGSHNIPRGRNIGLQQSATNLVAFVDSDDSAASDWTATIIDGFRRDPQLALLSGDLLPSFRTRTAQAIALNDAAVRKVTGSAIFCTTNCALNRNVLNGELFDEDFRFAEDLEFVSRLSATYKWRFDPQIQVHHFSRGTLAEYSKQMYRYGVMKQYFAFKAQTYRPLEFVPLGVMVIGGVASVVLRTGWPLLGVVGFSLMEAVFVVAVHRCPPAVAAMTLPAWLVKNLSWSAGIVRGTIGLAVDSGVRDQLRSKRVAHRF